MNLQLSDSVLIWEGKKVRPRPECLEIAEFKALWSKVRKVKGDSDGRRKLRNIQEFAYVFHVVSHKSPYAQYEDTVRAEQVKVEVFGEDSDWEPDELVNHTLTKYRELIKSPVIRLLDSALNTLARTSTYLDSVDYNEKSPAGQVYTVKDVLGAMAQIGKMLDSLQILREKAAKEEETGSKIRANVIVNEFSR